MAIAVALSDLCLGFELAAKKYRRFAARTALNFAAITDPDEPSRNIRQLARARANDATKLRRAAEAAGMSWAEPTQDAETLSLLLGLGKRPPTTPRGVLYRVLKTEKNIFAWVNQLRSIADHETIAATLDSMGKGIQTDLRRIEILHHMSTLDHKSIPRGVYCLIETAASKAPTAISKDQVLEVEVWYGTNRAMYPNGRLGSARSNKVTYGQCQVAVPEDRKIGSLGSGVLGRIFRGESQIRVLSTKGLTSNDFWAGIAARAEDLKPSKRHGLIYLHGFNTSFDFAARQTAQLKVDLEHCGPAAFFSWPSLGRMFGYSADEATIEASEGMIQSFLEDFADKSGVEAVHVIAHSMGNRALLRAMHEIAHRAERSSGIRFGQVFLAAPDVDVDLFNRLASCYPKLATRTTLYVTGNDRAIGLSKRLHRFNRVGLKPPVTVLQGIDTVDASEINLGLIGHGYAAGLREVLSDIFELVRRGTAPDERFGLRRATTDSHWEFRR